MSFYWSIKVLILLILVSSYTNEKFMESKVNVSTGLQFFQNIKNSLYYSVKTKIVYTVELLWCTTGLHSWPTFVLGIFLSSSKITLIMFTDDTVAFISNPIYKILFETMNEELRKIETWFKITSGWSIWL